MGRIPRPPAIEILGAPGGPNSRAAAKGPLSHSTPCTPEQLSKRFWMGQQSPVLLGCTNHRQRVGVPPQNTAVPSATLICVPVMFNTVPKTTCAQQTAYMLAKHAVHRNPQVHCQALQARPSLGSTASCLVPTVRPYGTSTLFRRRLAPVVVADVGVKS